MKFEITWNGSVTVEADSQEDAMYVFSDMDIDVDDEFQNGQSQRMTHGISNWIGYLETKPVTLATMSGADQLNA